MKTADAMEERKFLHDLANPLGTAMFIMDILLERIQEQSEGRSEDLKQLTQVMDALNKMKDLVQERGDILRSRGREKS